MAKLIIAAIGGTVLLMGGIILMDNGGIRASGGRIELSPANIDLGTVSMVNGNITTTYQVKNIGEEALKIDRVWTSCMCTTAALMTDSKQFGPYGMPGHGFIPKINAAIDPAKEATVEIVFNPAAHGPAGVGRIQRTITIENNAGQSLELEFAALVTP